MAMKETFLPLSALALPMPDTVALDRALREELKRQCRKIVVLDDDPTGVQTVHDVSVYTDWTQESLEKGFGEPESLFFVLTNSRGFSASHTQAVHGEIANRLHEVSKATGRNFLLISRGDSTLRGHYPLETATLAKQLANRSGRPFDGEVICPFFQEGGRYTLGNTHYVKENRKLVPVGQTEFAKDKTFGYTASHLGEWCQEKTGGQYRAQDCTYISLASLRSLDFDGIQRQLDRVEDFGKVIVNAVDEVDIQAFAVAFLRSLRGGKTFLMRTAAAMPKVLGGIPNKPLLEREELVRNPDGAGGLLIVGSHVGKTSRQLERLRDSGLPIRFVEFNAREALCGGLEQEANRVAAVAAEAIRSGMTVAVYTTREPIEPEGMPPERQLALSVEISQAVTSMVDKLPLRPAFLIAKGGITSSDVGIKGLHVKRARVMGQAAPGVPVWETGEESRFPGLPYVIFPGNVGEEDTLLRVTARLMGAE